MKRVVSAASLVAKYVIEQGKFNGTEWELFPKLPNCFTENLNFQRICGCNADFLRLTVNDNLQVQCWFADEDEDTFFLPFTSIIKTQPCLVTAIVTHVFDMIENLNESLRIIWIFQLFFISLHH